MKHNCCIKNNCHSLVVPISYNNCISVRSFYRINTSATRLVISNLFPGNYFYFHHFSIGNFALLSGYFYYQYRKRIHCSPQGISYPYRSYLPSYLPLVDCNSSKQKSSAMPSIPQGFATGSKAPSNILPASSL